MPWTDGAWQEGVTCSYETRVRRVAGSGPAIRGEAHGLLRVPLGREDIAKGISNRSILSAAPTPQDRVLQAKNYIKQLYRSLADQGLIAANDFESMKQYARSGGRRPPDARELRPKNAYNLLRLMDLATGWLREGEPSFQASGGFRDRLLSIKRGQVSLDEVLQEAEAMSPALEAARDASALPEHPDYQRANTLLKRVANEVARRHVEAVPGPFGRDAPAAPEPGGPEENADDA